MATKHAQPRRRSMRHPGHSYSEPGAYFVTVCVQDRQCWLGALDHGFLRLSDAGQVVERGWLGMPERFPTVLFDAFVVMPNHVHAIAMLGGIADSDLAREGAMNRAATDDDPRASENGHQTKPSDGHVTLGDVVRVFKAVSTRMIRSSIGSDFAWQSDYHDRIVRSERELDAIRAYIANNPLTRANDVNNVDSLPVLSVSEIRQPPSGPSD